MTYAVFKNGDMKPHSMPYIFEDDSDNEIIENGGNECVPPTDVSLARLAVVEESSGGIFSIIRLREGHKRQSQ